MKRGARSGFSKGVGGPNYSMGQISQNFKGVTEKFQTAVSTYSQVSNSKMPSRLETWSRLTTSHHAEELTKAMDSNRFLELDRP